MAFAFIRVIPIRVYTFWHGSNQVYTMDDDLVNRPLGDLPNRPIKC